MKNKKWSVIKILYPMSLILLFLAACNEFNEPGLIYDPDKPVPPDPVISGIDPADSALAGVQGREITILGSNFSPNTGFNFVYFGKQKALIKSSTVNQIVVYRPAIYGDSLDVIVQATPALASVYMDEKYKIENPYYAYDPDNTTSLITPTSAYGALEVDNEENLYIGSRRVIFMIPPAADTAITFKSLGTDFSRVTDLKFGPNGYLYILASRTNVYRTTAGGSAPEIFVTLSAVTEKLDFDQNQNMYTGYQSGISVIHQDASVIQSGRFASNFTIKELRVYNNELYVNAVYTGTDTSIPKTALWKHTILDANGTLDTNRQIVVDLSNYADPVLSTCDINSFNIDMDGTIYLCLRKTGVILPYYLYVVENGGSITPFYQDTILPKRLDHIVWGNDKEVYLNRGSSVLGADSLRVVRMKMGIDGAPYLGR
jgi:hypothetical protein